MGREVLQVKAQVLASDFINAQARRGRGRRLENRGMVRWLSPESGWTKINSDAAVSSAGRVDLGGVARNAEGVVQCCFAKNIPKCIALLRSLEFAYEKHLCRVIFEVDSQILCNAMLEIRDLLSRVVVAHSLASLAFDSVGLLFSESISISCMNSAIADSEA